MSCLVWGVAYAVDVFHIGGHQEGSGIDFQHSVPDFRVFFRVNHAENRFGFFFQVSGFNVQHGDAAVLGAEDFPADFLKFGRNDHHFHLRFAGNNGPVNDRGFVCPTCQCYDIRDFDTGHGIQRFRCWDSCMYSDFTKMAHGNSRNSQLERFRQRFMHKLVYQPMNNGGTFGCVGCGRCLSKCPINMNIVKVMKTLGGDK